MGVVVSQDSGAKIIPLLPHFICSMYSFFEKIETWLEVSSAPNSMHEKISSLKRSFSVSGLLYKEYGKMFGKLFNCNENVEEPKITKSRKRSK